MASGLAWSSAAKIASREMRSSRGKFLFVLLSVAIGVAALSGVRGFSSSFRATLLNRARSIMAGDLAARTFQQLTPSQQEGLDAIARTGVEITPVTEVLSMASSPKSMNPVLVSLKAVDPELYPFYGTVDLAPASSLQTALADGQVAVGDDLLLRLGLNVGDELKVGNRNFRIAATVVNEPDRLSGNFEAGPRVLMSRDSLEETGLIAPGSHALQRFLFKLPPPPDGRAVSDTAVADLKTRLETLLPDAQLTDYRETNPALTRGLDMATSLLSLMSLVALVLGAVGVAMAMRAHLQQRLDSIAIMKSLGARSGQIMKIYLLQTMLLGVAGGLLGVLFGVGVQLAFPVVLGKLINVPTEFHIQMRAVFVGLGAGVLTTLLFTLPPLLDIRGVRPILILRRAVEENDDPFIAAVWKKITKNAAQILATALILAGLAVIATMLSDSATVGKVFSAGLVAVLLVLLAASAGVLWRAEVFSQPHAAASAFVVAPRAGEPLPAGQSFGRAAGGAGHGRDADHDGVSGAEAVVSELHISSAPNLPNVFLVDIANTEIDGMRTLLKAQPGVTAEPELLPVVSSRIDAMDGVAAADVKLKNFPRRMLRSISLTWADAAPPGTKVVDGAWWKADESEAGAGDLAAAADRLGVKVGSTITFAAQDAAVYARPWWR